MLKSKSEFAKKLSHNAFKATDGWFLMEMQVLDEVQEGKWRGQCRCCKC
jgi:hypothetical protein